MNEMTISFEVGGSAPYCGDSEELRSLSSVSIQGSFIKTFPYLAPLDRDLYKDFHLKQERARFNVFIRIRKIMLLLKNCIRHTRWPTNIYLILCSVLK